MLKYLLPISIFILNFSGCSISKPQPVEDKKVVKEISKKIKMENNESFIKEDTYNNKNEYEIIEDTNVLVQEENLYIPDDIPTKDKKTVSEPKTNKPIKIVVKPTKKRPNKKVKLIKVNINNIDRFRYSNGKYYIYFYKSKKSCFDDTRYKTPISIKESFLNKLIKNHFNKNSRIVVLESDGSFTSSDKNLRHLDYRGTESYFMPFRYLSNLNDIIEDSVKEIIYFTAKKGLGEPRLTDYGPILKWAREKKKVTVFTTKSNAKIWKDYVDDIIVIK